jgi:hypothetical protein
MPQLHRRAVVIAAVASAFALGGTGATVASAAADTPATYPSAPSAPTAPGAMPGHAMFGGLFHALFDVFGAVRTQAPAIAAPVITDAVTAGTITPAEADQLTAMFASLGTPPTAPTGTGTGTPGTHTRPSFSAGQRTVLHAVADAIRTQLVTIATPVLDADVTAGTITAQQETMILSVLAHVAAPHGAQATPPAAPASAPAPADPAAALQQAVTHKVVAKALKAHRRAAHKSTRKAAAHR